MSKIYCKISIFVFSNLLNQFFWLFSERSNLLLLLFFFTISSDHIFIFILYIILLFFNILIFFIFIFIFIFVWGPKNRLQQMPPLYNTYGAGVWVVSFIKINKTELLNWSCRSLIDLKPCLTSILFNPKLRSKLSHLEIPSWRSSEF